MAIQAILPDAIYPKQSAKQFIGGEHAWREAKSRGLQTILKGKRVYVTGAALIEYLTAEPEPAESAA